MAMDSSGALCPSSSCRLLLTDGNFVVASSHRSAVEIRSVCSSYSKLAITNLPNRGSLFGPDEATAVSDSYDFAVAMLTLLTSF